MATKDLRWIKRAEQLALEFAKEHRLVLSADERQLAAAFEIGALHALLRFYRLQHYEIEPANLTEAGEYRYLTTPSGNPANYSYVIAKGIDGEFEIRQQVRIRSHDWPDIAFTPDIVVLVKDSAISAAKHLEFAGGKRPFYCVDSTSVVAAHECKSMNPFPELLVSFIGMLVAAHAWYPTGDGVQHSRHQGHLGPTLFVGGSVRGLHLRMVAAMAKAYNLNIICGLHEGTWNLMDAKNRIVWTPGGVLPEKYLAEGDLPF